MFLPSLTVLSAALALDTSAISDVRGLIVCPR